MCIRVDVLTAAAGLVKARNPEESKTTSDRRRRAMLTYYAFRAHNPELPLDYEPGDCIRILKKLEKDISCTAEIVPGVCH